MKKCHCSFCDYMDLKYGSGAPKVFVPEKPQFCAIGATGGIGLIQTHCPQCEEWPGRCRCAGGGAVTITTNSPYPISESQNFSISDFPSEAAVLIRESEARRLVTAIDNCRISDVITVIQRQPWFREVRRGVRATRHMRPNDYIELSQRPRDMAASP